MKRYFLLTICLMVYVSTKAQIPVTEEETCCAAVSYAQQMLNYKTITKSDIISIYAYQENNKTLMREVLFNNGLSIVFSSYKNCLPVLLYSTGNETVLNSINEIPAGLRDFVENFAAAIWFASDSVRTTYINPAWSVLLDTSLFSVGSKSNNYIMYGPLLTTKWGQDQSNNGMDCHAYNYFINATNTDCVCNPITHFCPTGCVATAMAQIMNYWKYPVWLPQKTIQYDWCNMPDELNKYIGEYLNEYNENYHNERNAIARLMFECGLAANMNYCYHNDCQSFAWPINARNALVEDFGYHSDASRKLRSSYSTNQWKKMIIKDLSLGRPVLYAGTSFKTYNYDENGHAFVCDGYYEPVECFHFNWGDNGNYFGVWCTIDNIIEGSYNWNHLERAVFNIYPSTTQDYCDFTLDLTTHYWLYYTFLGNTTPAPYLNIPKTATRLISVPKNSNIPTIWHTIPSGATTEYIAHEDILLQDGFFAEEGCDFNARIEVCISCIDREQKNYNSFCKDKFVTYNNDSQIFPKDSPKEIISLNNSNNFTDVLIFPNPANQSFTISFTETQESVKQLCIFDMQGKIMLRQENLSDNTVNISNLPSGTYIVQVISKRGEEYTSKLVKE